MGFAITVGGPIHASADGQIVVHHLNGQVGKSLRDALNAVQVPAVLINQILLGFRNKSGQTEVLPPAATFDVVYQDVLQDGNIVEPQLRSAMADTGTKTRRIYRYKADDSTTALVQEDGHGIALIDLGRPLRVEEHVTSPFGWRIHPVFGDRRFHQGVDFAAPKGTPVIAAADGVIEDIGYRGNYGDYIRLRHDGHLETAYAHLSGFVHGLRSGDSVKRGDVIAYVGRTGVATGPHLYYEVLIDGKHIDPLKAPSAVPVKLSGTQLAEFQKFVDKSADD